jgi:hypothetical protein
MLDLDEALPAPLAPLDPLPFAQAPYQRMLWILDYLGLPGAQVELQAGTELHNPQWHLWFADGDYLDLPYDLVVKSPEQAAYTIRDHRNARG